MSRRDTVSIALIKALVDGAYIEGYVQGAHHPPRASIPRKGRELSRLYWRMIEPAMRERLRASLDSPTRP